MNKLILLMLLMPSICVADYKWECVKQNPSDWQCFMSRLKVPHGWFVDYGKTTFFYPDENHEWK